MSVCGLKFYRLFSALILIRKKFQDFPYQSDENSVRAAEGFG